MIPDLVAQKQANGNFVGCVHDRRRGAAGARALHGERKARQRLEIGRVEVQPAGIGREVQPVAAAGPALRIRERVLDGQPHVRHAELGDDRAVEQLDHRVHDALRMDEHLNIVRRDAEQVHGLNEFQALIHHGRGVHADLRAHAPVRVADGHLGRDAARFFARPAAERAAGAGEQDLAQLALPAGQALEDGRVLGIDRHDLRAAFPGAAHDDVARAHERLLIGQRDAAALFNGRERRPQADRAGHCRDDGVRVREHRRLAQGVFPASDGNIRIGERDAQRLGRRLIRHGDERRVQAARLLFGELNITVRRQRAHVQAQMLRDGNSLAADAAGGAED